jgi:hypothetical protein
MMARLRTLAPAWPLLGFALLVMWQPTDEGLTLCPFARVTGMACPGCGLTRALAWLIRGDLGRTIFYHPMAPVIAFEIAIAWGLWMARRRGRFRWLDQRWVDVGLVATAVALLAVWVVRWVGGDLPPV